MRILVLKFLTDHPTLDFWLSKKYPIVFYTDDEGIFQTTINKELFVCKTFKLKRTKILKLVLYSFNYIFEKNEKTVKFIRNEVINSMKKVI